MSVYKVGRYGSKFYATAVPKPWWMFWRRGKMVIVYERY